MSEALDRAVKFATGDGGDRAGGSSGRPRVDLLAIPGSIRSESFNLAILRTLADLFSARSEMKIFGLGEIPPYNADLDTGNTPASVRAFKAAISACDGLVICSPEYNYGIPGVLKNAIDWASRPGFQSPLKGKPVLIMTASTGVVGGARAHAQIREALSSALCRVVARPQIIVPGVAEKIAGDRLVHQPTIDFISAAIDDLVAEIDLVGGVAV